MTHLKTFFSTNCLPRNSFGSADASIGQVVRINNDSYTIAGVVDSGPNGGGQGDTLLAYMPYSTYSARLTGTKTISQIFGYARENVDMKALADETKSWLLDWFNIPSAQAEDRVTVMTLSSIIEQMNATLMSFRSCYRHGEHFASGWRHWHHEHDAH